MSTLQELIEQDFGFSSDTQHTKVASDNSTDDQETTQLMAELGLLEETGEEKTASENQGQEELSAGEKIAGQLPVDSIFNEFFPEDGNLGKVASEDEKLASYQEAVGARAFDHYAARFDARIEKMAAETLTGDATISSPTDSTMNMDSNSDSRPPQTNPGNRPTDSGEAIDTQPNVEDYTTATNRNKNDEVGNQQQTDPEEKTSADLAMQKILLQQALAN